MSLLYRNYQLPHRLVSAIFVVALISSSAFGWQGGSAKPAIAKPVVPPLTSTERKASTRVKLQTIRDLTTTLSSKEFEGRGTAQPGGDKAANYIAEQFAKFGLKPAGENGSYLQPIKFRSTQVLPESSVQVGDTALQYVDDYVLLPPYSADSVDVSGDIVFAGYGAVSPELKRDDLAGLDLKGKVVVIVSGQPAGVETNAWRRATSPQARALNIFSRGAAAMLIANVGTPAQPFTLLANYLSRRRVTLASSPQMMFKVPPVLLVSEKAMEKLFAGSPMTYAQTLEKAKSGEMLSRDMGKQATMALRFKKEETTGSNVAGVFEGSDPKLKEEAVVYTAHYDAYGIENGRIYPGAADNALGTATIMAIAEAFAKAFPKPESRPRRSIIFLAVTGEEYGLYGAEHWVRKPTWPLQKIAANINFDGMGTEVYGPVRHVVAFGAEHSELGKIFEEVTNATGNVVTPDQVPEENAFVRSDHYAFVKRGVPALMLMGYPEDLAGSVARMKRWIDTDYHSTSDTVKPDWDWRGPENLAQVGMIIGLRVANAEAMPAWRNTSPFNKPRAANPKRSQPRRIAA